MALPAAVLIFYFVKFSHHATSFLSTVAGTPAPVPQIGK
jgi:hypothetical protein